MKLIFYRWVYFLFFFAVIAFSALFLSKSKVFASDIVVNEIFPYPLSGEKEWVEFYNSAETEIDLSNYYFDDDDSLLTDGQIQKGTSDPGSDPQKLLGIIPPKLTCFLSLSSYLNNDKDKPSLFTLDGTVIDSYEYMDSIQNKSFTRIPDGSEWQAGQDPSKSTIECSSLAPTPSPTPTPIEASTPTQTQSPTRTPTPTKSPTPTKTPTPKVTTASKLTATLKPTVIQTFSLASATKAITPTQAKLIKEETQKLTPKVSGKMEINFLTKTPTASETPKMQTEVLGSNTNNILPKILIGIGSAFILACGILAIKTYRKERNQN